MSIRVFRMTIASVWYDERSRAVREHEMHFKVSRRGQIRNVRRTLAQRGGAYFQRAIYRRFNRWIPKRKIRISFEREEPALVGQNRISISVRRMEGQGKRWKAFSEPSISLTYSRRRGRRG